MNPVTGQPLSEAPEVHGTETAAACIILGLSFLVGVPGNLFVIWTILRHIKQRSHSVNLILHLALADTAVLITLPVWIYSLIYSWVFGEALCKTLVYCISVCMYSSISFIALMNIERFVAVWYPFFVMRWKTKSVMNRFLIVLWLFAFCLGLPAIWTQTLGGSDGANQCLFREFNKTQAIIILLLETVVGLMLPLMILCVCSFLVSARLRKLRFDSKQKSMILVHAVVIGFVICWLPHHIVNIIDVVCMLKSDVDHTCVPDYLVFSSGALVFISSSINPLLYTFFAKNFRGSLEASRLVRLFQEVTTFTNKLRELGMQQQHSEQRSVELMSDSSCEKDMVDLSD